MRNRPRGVLQMGWACVASAYAKRHEHAPIAPEIPDSVVERIAFDAGGGIGWRLSALHTPRPDGSAPWKVAVVTGAPSWAEYWAEALVAAPAEWEMLVVDRPGFAFSEPLMAAPDVEVQARALQPILATRPGQRLILVGQSYGAPIAALMAAAEPERVAGLMLLSSYLGVAGPTAKRLVDLGSRFLGVIPRDLRNAVMEVRGQPAQLPAVRLALQSLRMPIHVVHGDMDDFAPLEVSRALAERTIGRGAAVFRTVAGANHFLNDGPPEQLLNEIAALIGTVSARPATTPLRPAPAGAPALAEPVRMAS